MAFYRGNDPRRPRSPTRPPRKRDSAGIEIKQEDAFGSVAANFLDAAAADSDLSIFGLTGDSVLAPYTAKGISAGSGSVARRQSTDESTEVLRRELQQRLEEQRLQVQSEQKRWAEEIDEHRKKWSSELEEKTKRMELQEEHAMFMDRTARNTYAWGKHHEQTAASERVALANERAELECKEQNLRSEYASLQTMRSSYETIVAEAVRQEVLAFQAQQHLNAYAASESAAASSGSAAGSSEAAAASSGSAAASSEAAANAGYFWGGNPCSIPGCDHPKVRPAWFDGSQRKWERIHGKFKETSEKYKLMGW